MKQYTANELNAIRKLNEAVIDDQPTCETHKNESPHEDSFNDDLGFNADDFFSALQEQEEPIEKQIENSYIQRSQTGQGLIKLHGKTTPNRIFW